MHTNRPYLLRAFYEWIVNNHCTPILVVDAQYPNCKVPRDYVEGGEIVFNISMAAVRDLRIGNDFIEFKASFTGVIHLISVPVMSVLALYAEENNKGIFLESDEDDESIMIPIVDGSAPTSDFDHRMDAADIVKPINKGKPFLRLIE